MKHCNTCATTKDISEFSKDKTMKDGFNSKCKLCVKQYRKDNAEKIAARTRKWKLANPEKRAAHKKKYQQAHPEKVAACSKRWREKNPKQFAATRKKYTQANPEKEAARIKKYKQENPDKKNAINAKRRAAKLQRTPVWLTGALEAQIQAIYAQAQEKTRTTGIQHQVDHIVPLQGANVSGLHIPDNLQILTQHENCSKSNKH